MESGMTSGTIPEWIRNERRRILRGVTFLRSLEKRLSLSHIDARNKDKSKIPLPVLAAVADVLAAKYTHGRLDSLMKKVGVLSATPPEGNKIDRARGWLELANSEDEPLQVLGKSIEEVMEVDSFGILTAEPIETLRQKIEVALHKHGLAYSGSVYKLVAGAVARTLEQMAREKDLVGVQTEFDRILDNLEKDPPSAVTASCSLPESLFKVYIEEEALTLPSDESIKSLWNVVRKDLKFDPAVLQDENLRKILSGLASITDGIAALRTHKGSAHGHGKVSYRVKPRHARLAVHAASTVATFLLETWDEHKT
jgi:Abortive infection C-terminus